MKRIVPTAIAVVALQSLLIPSTFADTANTTDKAKIQEIVHQYLLDKPEVVVEALQKFQQKQYEQAEKTVKQTQKVAPQFSKSLFHQANDPVAGNPNGKVTVVEFFDYQCPHCLDMAPVFDSAIKSNPNLRVVYKEWPIRGKISEVAARAALAANAQGKYYDFHHALLTSKQQPLTEEIIFQLAKDQGIDVEKLKTDMNGNTVNELLKSTMKLAQDLKLFGTPAIFAGQTTGSNSTEVIYIPGEANQKQLQEVIDKLGKS